MGAKLTNEQEANRPALSSPNEVITMLNRTERKEHENKTQGKTQQETPRN